MGFEPTRGDPIGLAGRRLNRSAKVSLTRSLGNSRLIPFAREADVIPCTHLTSAGYLKYNGRRAFVERSGMLPNITHMFPDGHAASKPFCFRCVPLGMRMSPRKRTPRKSLKYKVKNAFDHCLLTFCLNHSKKHDFTASPRLKKKIALFNKQKPSHEGRFFFGFWCFWEAGGNPYPCCATPLTKAMSLGPHAPDHKPSNESVSSTIFARPGVCETGA